MNSHRKPGLLLVLLVLAAITVPARAAAEETGTFDRTLNVSGPVDLDVRSGSGDINIHVGGSNIVHVAAKVRARDSWLMGMSAKEKIQKITSNPPVEQQGNMIRIGRIEDRNLQQNVSIDYDVTVPAQTKVTSQTGSGDQKISGVLLPLTARTGSGGVMLDQVGADARVSSGSGDLKINSIKGTLTADTGSGNIVAQGIAGAIVAHTGSGEIELEQVAAGDVNVGTGSGNVKLRGVKGGLRAQTGSGDIEAEGAVMHDWRVGAGSGTIRLKVPAQASFNLDARTSSGTLKVNHPVTMQGTMSRNHIQGKVGNGGVLMELHTGSGDIYVD